MKFVKSIGIGAGALVLFALLGYALGPTPQYESVDPIIGPIEIKINELEEYIRTKEGAVEGMKKDNEARIIWADSSQQKTSFSVVYLHGFSASQEEGDPLHESFAQRYGFNLFLSRLAGHGLQDSSSFEKLTPSDLMESAKEAIAIGRILGDEVIVMSCSTGGTLSAYLAAHNPGMIHSQFMYSPNIDIRDPMSEMLTMPWGYEIARMSFGGERNHITYTPQRMQYWNDAYHINGLIATKALIEETMVEETFKKIEQPLFIGYYYRDEENQDDIVSVDRMKDFFQQVSTPSDQKKEVSFPDAGRHVITSYMTSEDMEGVMNETFDFAESVLGFKPLQKSN
ncbi:MAG: alpha/beta hydrolase [Saprospiraceae bacterium]|nr:alpha/beta hydrolase [Saprospiraceae bacterium]